MKKLLLSFLFLSIYSFSQTTVDKWYFSYTAGLNFTGGGPSPITTSGMNSPESCASISDASGNLLFYTDGVTVWNKNNITMANGTGLLGHPSSTQGALIVPTPSNASQYYIFTTDAQGGVNGLRYSIVDMSLSAGLGSVTSKNILMLTPVCEKLAAIKNPITNKLWLAAHGWGDNNFYSYEITGTGLQTPVISSVGVTYSGNISYAVGQMKFNSCGTQLALAGGVKDTVQVFNFNPSSGQVSSPITIPLSGQNYGVEFSAPLGNLLYVTTCTVSSIIAQYDLNAGSQAAINASKTTVGTGSYLGSLQMGPDSKIYCTQLNSKFIGVINSPNSPGVGCNYVANAINLDPLLTGNKCFLGLPALMIDNYFPCGIVGIKDQNIDRSEIIFPNPSASDFNLKIKTGSLVEVYSYDGMLVEKFKTDDSNNSFGKSYASGIYFVRINNETTIKLVKE